MSVIDHEHGVGRGFKRTPEAFFVLTQVLFGDGQFGVGAFDGFHHKSPVNQEIGDHLVDMAHDVIGPGHGGVNGKENLAHGHDTHGGKQGHDVCGLRHFHAVPQNGSGQQVQCNDQKLAIDLDGGQAFAGNEPARHLVNVFDDDPLQADRSRHHDGQHGPLAGDGDVPVPGLNGNEQ